MAKVKLSTIGATKSLRVLMNFDYLCFNCKAKQSFKSFQIDHIVPQKFYRDNNLPINNSLENLCCLCRKCNAIKGNQNISEFYTKKQISELKKLVKRNIPQSEVFEIGEKIAKENPTGKFAKLFRNGMFAQ
jgi:CRISPR/Cas system Type II protein with McrA/HNH and RuvC-like nuclease domain